MTADEEQLFACLERLDEGTTVVTSVRQPAALREALRVAVHLGMDESVNDATVQAVRDRLEAFAQRRALEAHYEEHPEARPSLGDLALAGAELDGSSLADDPDLVYAAARQIAEIKADATPDDVLVYAAGMRARETA